MGHSKRARVSEASEASERPVNEASEASERVDEWTSRRATEQPSQSLCWLVRMKRQRRGAEMESGLCSNAPTLSMLSGITPSDPLPLNMSCGIVEFKAMRVENVVDGWS